MLHPSEELLGDDALDSPDVRVRIDSPQARRRAAWRRVGAFLGAGVLFATATALVSLNHSSEDADSQGIDPTNLDLDVNPGVDFYLFANGNWIKRHPVPEDRGMWGTFSILQDDTSAKLRGLLDQAAAEPAADAVAAKVGQFWSSAMNVSAIEAAGVTPLDEIRRSLVAAANASAYGVALGLLHRWDLDALFSISADPNPQNSQQVILWIDQGGLGLPDRSYYFAPEHAEVRAAYRRLLADLLALLGRPADDAAAAAGAVLAVEARLAAASQTQEYRQDPDHQLNLMNASDLASMTNLAMDWEVYAETLAIDLAGGPINVPNTDFLAAVGDLLQNATLQGDLSDYFVTRLLLPLTPVLPEAFSDAKFRYEQVLNGEKSPPARWKRMVNQANDWLGQLVGQLYCRDFFPAASKERALETIVQVRDSFRRTLQNLEWMGNRTRQEAVLKLDRMGAKVGYPDQWIDYSPLMLDAAIPVVTNILAARAFAVRRDLGFLWHAPDPQRWYIPPQTVDAYYAPRANEIVFPAAILQAPFFDPEFDLAVNFGGLAAVVGHEMTHGFDTAGRKYDAQGNLRDWWEPLDEQRFKARAAQIVEQFSQYTILGRPVNGERTQGENIADLGGLNLAYRAMLHVLKANYTLDGFTHNQRFFLAYAQVWHNSARDEALLHQLAVDSHAPSEWRVKGPLSNMPDFYAAFGVQPGQPMWRKPEDRVVIW